MSDEKKVEGYLNPYVPYDKLNPFDLPRPEDAEGLDDEEREELEAFWAWYDQQPKK